MDAEDIWRLQNQQFQQRQERQQQRQQQQQQQQQQQNQQQNQQQIQLTNEQPKQPIDNGEIVKIIDNALSPDIPSQLTELLRDNAEVSNQETVELNTENSETIPVSEANIFGEKRRKRKRKRPKKANIRPLMNLHNNEVGRKVSQSNS